MSGSRSVARSLEGDEAEDDRGDGEDEDADRPAGGERRSASSAAASARRTRCRAVLDLLVGHAARASAPWSARAAPASSRGSIRPAPGPAGRLAGRRRPAGWPASAGGRPASRRAAAPLAGRRRQDLDRRAVAQAVLADDDDLLALGEPGDDLDEVALAEAQLDLAARRRRRPRPRRPCRRCSRATAPPWGSPGRPGGGRSRRRRRRTCPGAACPRPRPPASPCTVPVAASTTGLMRSTSAAKRSPGQASTVEVGALADRAAARSSRSGTWIGHSSGSKSEIRNSGVPGADLLGEVDVARDDQAGERRPDLGVAELDLVALELRLGGLEARARLLVAPRG